MPDDTNTPDSETPGQGDRETPKRDTYTPRKTRYVSCVLPSPTGETRTVTYRLRAGQTYRVVAGDTADAELGYAAVNNVSNVIRESAIPNR